MYVVVSKSCRKEIAFSNKADTGGIGFLLPVTLFFVDVCYQLSLYLSIHV